MFVQRTLLPYEFLQHIIFEGLNYPEIAGKDDRVLIRERYRKRLESYSDADLVNEDD